MFCRRLERAGHITMVKNDKDARFINVVLTEKAQAIAKLPTRASSYDTLTEYNEYPRSLFKEQSLNTGHPRPRTPGYTVLSPGFSEAMMNMFTGADVKESLDQLAADFDSNYQKNYAE